MLKKFLKDIVSSIAGKQAEEIIELLDGKRYINEFLIAKKLNLTINQTRNILYKISDYGLVSSIRKKDKKKGWYTYFWKLEILKCLEFLKGNLLIKMGQIQNQIRIRETKEFYFCETCNIEFTEETALVNNFTCNECGNIVSRKDNAPAIREYNRELEKLKKELGFVEEELKLEKEKIEKAREKERKKEEKDKLSKKTVKPKKSVKKTSKKKEAKNPKNNLIITKKVVKTVSRKTVKPKNSVKKTSKKK